MSDEVGVVIMVTPIEIGLSTVIGSPQKTTIRENNVDDGDHRPVRRTLFQGTKFAAVSVTIVGHEVDSEAAYRKQTEDFLDAYGDVIKSSVSAITVPIGAVAGAGTVYALGLVAAGASPVGWVAALAVAIAAVVTLAIDFFVALWARADLLMEDSFALLVEDFALLTSANFPMPEPAIDGTKTTGDITIKVFPKEKRLVNYVERREYTSDARYSLVLRYERV